MAKSTGKAEGTEKETQDTGLGGEQIDWKEMAKSWKAGYLGGLDAYLQWQEENERLIKNMVMQGLAGPRQGLSLYKEWMDMPWDQIGKGISGVPNPFLALSRQYTQTLQGTTEPLLKNAESTCENAFDYYETAIAAPGRKYVREFNKQVMDTLIPE